MCRTGVGFRVCAWNRRGPLLSCRSATLVWVCRLAGVRRWRAGWRTTARRPTRGSGLLAGSTAVNAAHAQLTAAAIRCTFRMQATATKLAVGSIGYAENQASSAAQLWALGQEAVC